MRRTWRSKSTELAASTADFEAVKVVLELIRAQSTIRFAALPFFLAALAILTKTLYEPDLVDRRLIALAALGLTIVAVVIEIVLSRNLLAWWTAIDPVLRQRESWRAIHAHRNPASLSWARWALLSPYIVALVFWLHRSLCLLFPPPAGISEERHFVALSLVAGVVGLATCFTAAQAWRSAGQRVDA
jgi:hypothetical protein